MNVAPFLQHFFVMGKYLGASPRNKVWVHAEQQSPRSLGFVCPVCGDAWAKAPVEPASGNGMAQWEVMMRPCPKHQQSRYDVPGSITLSWDPDFNDSFPPDVIRWEFQQHLNLFPDSSLESGL